MILWRTSALLAFAAVVGCAGFATEAGAQGSATGDRTALVALYGATDGPNWVHRTNWNTTAPLGQWYGVQTDTRGRVVRLDLERNGLSGAIPTALRNLDRLEILDLSQNDLTGAVPAGLGDLSNLQWLYLWGNDLTGTIPAALRNLDRLEALSLGENGLTGTVPGWLGELSNLRFLLLWENELTGAIPSTLRNLDRLESLSLEENRLTGAVPGWLGELSNLQFLWLEENELTGAIPAGLGNLEKLELLSLGGNRLTGSVPTGLGDLSRLRWLSVWGNELTGTLPTTLQNLDSLELLNFNANDLSGTLPTWLGELSSLEWLGLGRNRFTGPIPASLGNLEGLESLRLWNNELTGTIPTALRDLDELVYLDIGGNDLSGPVPTWLGELSNLTRLGLYNNEFIGAVPTVLGRLQYLEELYLAYNPLTGTLPHDLMRLSQLTDLDIRATAVCAPSDDPFLVWLATVETFRGDTCNRAPTTVEAIPAQTLTAPESLGVPVAAYFTDPDDDVLFYMAEPQPATRVTAVVSGDTVWLSANEAGEATVAVAACDPDRLCAEQTMQVTVQAETTASQSDREALETLYDATGGDGWTDKTNWKTTAALDSWHGVTTGPTGRVTRLELWSNGLTGAIPAALRSLDELEVLNLGDNSLGGPIPPWLGSMSSLRSLALWGNDLTGPVPAELGSLTDLFALQLCCNELTGPIPDPLRNLDDLEWLSLGWNNLTGPVPTWVAGLGSLRGLWLHRNELSGPIPTGLGALSELRTLALGPNDLTPGPIPAELGDLAHLERLWLGGANRTGPIPPELGRLTNLRYLSLYGNGLSGAIPEDLAQLTDLSHLYLSGNFGLSGPLPPEWQLPDLEDLDIFLTKTCAPEAWREQLTTITFWGTICGTGAEPTTVDVAVVYTPAAREAAGGTEAVEAGIDLMIAVTNTAFQDSGVRSRVALVARSEVAYAETGVALIDLRRFREPSDGHMDGIHEIRERAGADLVHLIVAESDFGGRAWVAGAFGLSRWPGGAVPHELGHNLGLRHDRFEVATDGRLRPDPAYGYVNAQALEAGAPRSSQWRTIMAYVDQCKDRFTYCARVPRFSNPRQRYNGDRMGVPFDDEAASPGLIGPADAAAVIDVTAPAVAAWRDRPPAADRPTATGTPGIRSTARATGWVQTAPPGPSTGLFADALLAAQTPGPGAPVAPGFPPSSDFPSLRRRLVAVDFDQLGAAATELPLNLFDDAVFTGLVEETEPTFSGGYTLSGRLAGVELSTVTLVVNSGVVAGLVWTPEATYRVSPAGGGFHTISQVDRSQLPPLGDPLPRPLPAGDQRNPPRRQ